MTSFEQFNKWLWTDGGAGWVFGGIFLIKDVYKFINRQRPTKVICKEINR